MSLACEARYTGFQHESGNSSFDVCRAGARTTTDNMPRKTELVIAPESLESVIYVVRGQRVMLDADLARLYDVTIGALNQAVKRNPLQVPG